MISLPIHDLEGMHYCIPDTIKTLKIDIYAVFDRDLNIVNYTLKPEKVITLKEFQELLTIYELNPKAGRKRYARI